MSYELCNRISVNEKKNVIKLSTDSNNVFPKTYTSWEFYKDSDMNFNEKMFELFKGIIEGNIQFSSINDSTIDYAYADNKVREYLHEKGLSVMKVWDMENEERNKMYKELFEVFTKALKEEIKGIYGLEIKGMRVVKLGKYNSRFGNYGRVYHSYYTDEYLKMNYKKAYIVAKDFSNSQIIRLDSEVA